MTAAIIGCVAALSTACKTDSDKGDDDQTGGASNDSSGGASAGGAGGKSPGGADSGAGGSNAGGSPLDDGGTGGTSGSGGTPGTGGTPPSEDGGVDAGPTPPPYDEKQKGTGPFTVLISRIGQNLHLELIGTGFGDAPRTLPAITTLQRFKLTNKTGGGWCAGGAGCQVNLQYTSWTDGKIVIDGFGLEYGGQYKLAVGDTVEIVVTDADGKSQTWTGKLELRQDPPLMPDGPTPQVESVKFSVIGPNMRVQVNGAGFGAQPRTLPAVTTLQYFKMTDRTSGGWCAGGAGCQVNLQYTSWEDGQIVIDGFGLEYGAQFKVAEGDEVSMLIYNYPGPEFTVWTGKLSESPLPEGKADDRNPRVTKVTFTDVGKNMHMQVDGTGFGEAPRTFPAVTTLQYFTLTDSTSGGWCAGGAGCQVNLQYTSWNKTRIVIDGFGTEYGPQYKVEPGDSIRILLYNYPGPQFTIWDGALPTGL